MIDFQKKLEEDTHLWQCQHQHQHIDQWLRQQKESHVAKVVQEEHIKNGSHTMIVLDTKAHVGKQFQLHPHFSIIKVNIHTTTNIICTITLGFGFQ